MSASQDNQAPLPARPTADADSAAFAPSFPWRYWVIAGVAIVLLVGAYLVKEARKAAELRAQILRVHEALQEPSKRYFAFRDKVEKLVLSASAGVTEPLADKRLRIEGLRSGRGLYLRVRAKDLKDEKTLAAAAADTDPDVINACMGLSPVSARGLWQQGEFMAPAHIEEAKNEHDVMDLRVMDEMLARKLRTDLPAVLSLTQSDWLLLVVQRGDNRRDQPVDVFLWDLRSDLTLLSARIQAQGALMPTRVRAQGAPGAPRLYAEDVQGSGATDCSIAMQIKQLAGAEIVEVRNVPELPARPPAPAAPAAPAPPPAGTASPAPANAAPP